MNKVVYNGDGVIFGRLASKVAKDLLKGNSVDVLNCEKIIVSGDRHLFAKKILDKRVMGSGSSLKGPKYPRAADRLVKRMIRGMLPRDRAKGRDAFKRLKCYVDMNGFEGNAIELNYKVPAKVSSIADIVKLLK